MKFKLGQIVLYRMTGKDNAISRGNNQELCPAAVVAIWENEYPNNPVCTTGLNLKVLTDAPNDLWITSAELYHPAITHNCAFQMPY